MMNQPSGISVSPPPCWRTHGQWIMEPQEGLCYEQEKHKSVTDVFLSSRGAEVLELHCLWTGSWSEAQKALWPQWEKMRCNWGEDCCLQALRHSVRGGLGGSALTLLLEPWLHGSAVGTCLCPRVLAHGFHFVLSLDHPACPIDPRDTHPGWRLARCPIESVSHKAGGRASLGPAPGRLMTWMYPIFLLIGVCRCSIITVQWFNFLRQNPLCTLSTSSLQLWGMNNLLF